MPIEESQGKIIGPPLPKGFIDGQLSRPRRLGKYNTYTPLNTSDDCLTTITS